MNWKTSFMNQNIINRWQKRTSVLNSMKNSVNLSPVSSGEIKFLVNANLIAKLVKSYPMLIKWS
jgi:hypothetical protein